VTTTVEGRERYPVNVRYATDSRNMAVWTLHNAARYCFVATEGPVVLFDFHNCAFLSAGLPLIGEVRPARAWYYFAAGPRVDELAHIWAAEIAELVRREFATAPFSIDASPGRIAVLIEERFTVSCARALARGLERALAEHRGEVVFDLPAEGLGRRAVAAIRQPVEVLGSRS
jgi:hypothetical protein